MSVLTWCVAALALADVAHLPRAQARRSTAGEEVLSRREARERIAGIQTANAVCMWEIDGKGVQTGRTEGKESFGEAKVTGAERECVGVLGVSGCGRVGDIVAMGCMSGKAPACGSVSYTHLRAHETEADL
eukprot:2700046-Rhodomonas_salina.1